MKQYKTLLSIVVIGTQLFIAGCDDSDELDNKKEFINRIAFTWQIERVTVGGKDVTKSFDSLTVSIHSDKTYRATHAVSPIWPEEGALDVSKRPNAEIFNVLRDDGILLTVTEVTASRFKYKLHYDAPGGRAKGVSGEYEFSMIK